MIKVKSEVILSTLQSLPQRRSPTKRVSILFIVSGSALNAKLAGGVLLELVRHSSVMSRCFVPVMTDEGYEGREPPNPTRSFG